MSKTGLTTFAVFRLRANGAGFMVPLVEAKGFEANRVYELVLTPTDTVLSGGKRLRVSIVEKFKGA